MKTRKYITEQEFNSIKGIIQNGDTDESIFIKNGKWYRSQIDHKLVDNNELTEEMTVDGGGSIEGWLVRDKFFIEDFDINTSEEYGIDQEEIEEYLEEIEE